MAAATKPTRTFLLYINPPSVAPRPWGPMYAGVDEYLLNAGIAGFFPLFHFVPQRIPGRGIQARQGPRTLAGQRFHGAEPPFELGIREPQRLFRVDTEMPRPVRDREQQVTDLVGTLLGRRRGDLAQFLVDLGAHAALVGPVEPDTARTFAELGRARQRRQCQRHVRQLAGRLRAARGALAGLVFFPR